MNYHNFYVICTRLSRSIQNKNNTHTYQFSMEKFKSTNEDLWYPWEAALIPQGVLILRLRNAVL
jgi:hypothetical protein